MASSSLSQEDYEHDFELSSRRSRIRTARAANTRAVPLRTCADVGSYEADGDIQAQHLAQSMTAHPMDSENTVISTNVADHDASPKPLPRAKDKRCTRTNHINKGKVQRERRKLREKRRSTGVVHLQSTESTGGSTGEDDESLMCSDIKRNTTLNEGICKEEPAEAPSQVKTYPRLNKSPSDLDADDEDNQEYDSTLNQSDSTVSLVQDNHVSGTGDAEQQDGDATDDILDEGELNGQPTPGTTLEPEENLEKLLHSAKEEIKHLLEQSKEKDHKITLLEQKVNSLNRELLFYDAQNKKLLEENRSLLNALSELKT